jgi:hypothetical protein
MDTGSRATHLLLVYDDAGEITGVGKLDQDMMDREGLGQVFLEADGRHFAQLAVDDETRDASHEDLMTNFEIDHREGNEARISRKSG